MMKMRNRVAAFVCCAALVCALMTGCRLAREDMAADLYADRLIGVFITTEYIDLFDIDSYMDENINYLAEGEIVLDGDTDRYQGRIYATPVTETVTDENGQKSESTDYVFENMEGIRHFYPTEKRENGNYVNNISDSAISDGYVNVHLGDDTEEMAAEGTLYVVPPLTEVYYFNTVYQSADERVYLTSSSGMGHSVSDNDYEEGEQMSPTLKTTHTYTENGRTKTYSFSITISINVMFAPEKIVILQMGADGKPVSRDEYAPGKLPETLTPESGADYLIVETHKKDAVEKPRVSREIYGADAEELTTFYAREDGICVQQGTHIAWPGADNAAAR
jgi:hypothetical protein